MLFSWSYNRDRAKEAAKVGKVFITQECGFNYEPAEEFGEVEFVTADEYSPLKSSIRNLAVLRSVKRFASLFNPETDFVAPSGSPTITGLCFLALGHRGHKRVPVLAWSNQEKKYRKVVLEMDDVEVGGTQHGDGSSGGTRRAI